MPDDKVLSLLERGRDRVSKAWIRSEYWDEDRVGCCALGALMDTPRDFRLPYLCPPGTPEFDASAENTAVDYLTKALALRPGKRFWTLPEFNDHAGTTQQDVVELYEDAIEIRKAQTA